MSNYDYEEIGEVIGGLIGCALVSLLMIFTVVSIVALPFILITFLTSAPSVF